MRSLLYTGLITAAMSITTVYAQQDGSDDGAQAEAKNIIQIDAQSELLACIETESCTYNQLLTILFTNKQ